MLCIPIRKNAVESILQQIFDMQQWSGVNAAPLSTCPLGPSVLFLVETTCYSYSCSSSTIHTPGMWSWSLFKGPKTPDRTRKPENVIEK